jgi:FkbM family methyltransferase
MAFIDRALALRPLLSRWRSIYYSQYSEDTLLAALHPERRGFYVDVGAYHPWRGSNTYKLYRRGWRGLTIEPNPDTARLFRRFRPGDIHIVKGVSPEPSELRYYRFDNPTLNTFSPEEAEARQARLERTQIVQCLPLSDLLNEHAGGRAVDLLSVDCEGMDLQVLQSLDWNAARPTVIIVEDLDQFRALKLNTAPSPTSSFLRDVGYVPVSQGVFSFLYVDAATIAERRRTPAFRLDISQVQA